MSRLAKFDKIAIGEVTVNLLGPSHVMVAKAKLVSTKSGASFGSTTIQHWSPAVLAKLEELRVLMESEMEAVFFDEDRPTSGLKMETKDEPAGLRRYLEDDDVGDPA